VGLGLVTRIPNLMEAHIAVGALRSAGIAAELFDGNFGAVESPVIEGLGGYRLMAPQEQVAEARETLKALRSMPGLSTGEDEAPWGPPAAAATSTRARAKGMRIVTALLLGAPVIVWLILSLLR
jgi:hypothetical protein